MPCARCAAAWSAACTAAISAWFCPDSAREAAFGPAAQVFGAAHLLDVVAHLLGQPGGEGWRASPRKPPSRRTSGPDLADVKGQVQAKRALRLPPLAGTACWWGHRGGQIHAGPAL